MIPSWMLRGAAPQWAQDAFVGCEKETKDLQLTRADEDRSQD